MKTVASIFLSISFDDTNRARFDVIASIVRLKGFELLLGTDLNGNRVSESVQGIIERCDALIAIFSRGDQLGTDTWTAAPWVVEEATWAYSRSKPVLRIVEDGVTRMGGIAGDVEQVRFQSGHFEICIPRIISFTESLANRLEDLPSVPPVEQDQTLSVVPKEPIPEAWSEKVKKLLMDAREKAELQLFQEALQLSNRAIELDSMCWRAHINRGVALVHLRQFQSAKETFDHVANGFTDQSEVVALALHNTAWLISRRDGLENAQTLQIRKGLYLQALSLNARRINTRALVCIYFLLCDEADQARPFLETSLRSEGFVGALRSELDGMGTLGSQAVEQFPAWLRDLLYPTTPTTVGGN